MQQAAFDHYSLPIRYHRWPAPPRELEAAVHRLRDKDHLGANVTAPHKQAVPAYLDDIDQSALSVGAVNTIVREGDRLLGLNTDTYGFIKGLRDMGGFDPGGRRALLLGAGGAARAVAFALASEKVASLIIANRTLSRAQSLADDIRASFADVEAIGLTGVAIREASGRADLIVNSTTVGTGHGSSGVDSLLQADLIPASALVYDIVYNPAETPLLWEAKRAGAGTLGGIAMLVHQGAASFERWTGKVAPVDAMFAAAEKALTQMEG